MAFSRYSRTKRLRRGQQFGTPTTIQTLRNAANDGIIATRIVISREGERLDTLAGQYYGDARLWWVIAACSGIGFAPQVPPGTRLTIPTKISEVKNLVG